MRTAKSTIGHASTGSNASRSVFKYLTPHKVLLLVLIHAYCTASVPTKYHAAIFTHLLLQIEVKHLIRVIFETIKGTTRAESSS